MGGEGGGAEAGVGDSGRFSLCSGEEDPSKTKTGKGGACDVMWGAGEADGGAEGDGIERADQHSLCGTSEFDSSAGDILSGTAHLGKRPIQCGA